MASQTKRCPRALGEEPRASAGRRRMRCGTPMTWAARRPSPSRAPPRMRPPRLAALPSAAEGGLRDLQQGMAGLVEGVARTNLRAAQEMFRLGDPVPMIELQQRFAREYTDALVRNGAALAGAVPHRRRNAAPARAADRAARPSRRGRPAHPARGGVAGGPEPPASGAWDGTAGALRAPRPFPRREPRGAGSAGACPTAWRPGGPDVLAVDPAAARLHDPARHAAEHPLHPVLRDLGAEAREQLCQTEFVSIRLLRAVKRSFEHRRPVLLRLAAAR